MSPRRRNNRNSRHDGRPNKLRKFPSFSRFGRMVMKDTFSMVRIVFITFVVMCVPVLFLATSREKETLAVAGAKIGRVIVKTATSALDKLDRLLFGKASKKFPKEKRR